MGCSKGGLFLFMSVVQMPFKNARATLHSLMYRASFSDTPSPELSLAIIRVGQICQHADSQISDLLEQVRIIQNQRIKTLSLMNDALKIIEDSYLARRQKANYAISNKSLRMLIFSRDGFKCKSCDSSSSLTIDHIIPVKAGGDNRPSNLQTLCRRCNSSKGAKQ